MVDRLLRAMPLMLVLGALTWIAQRSVRPVSDPDDWWHLRLGNDLIADHSLSAPDHWSSFATLSWVPTEAVPEIVSAFVERWLGLPGLAVLFALFSMLVAAAVYLTNRQEAGPVAASVSTVFAVLAASGSLTSRPQLVSFVLIPVVLAAWLRTERDLRPRWWLIPVFWAWALCHGFWLIGAGLGLIVAVGIVLGRRAEARRAAQLVGLALACFAVVLLSPIGLGVLEAPFAVHSTSQYITEWQRTDLLLPGPLCCALMIVVTALVWVTTRQGVSWARIGLLLIAAVCLVYAVRLVIVAGLVSAPLLAGALETLVARGGGSERRELSRRTEWRWLVGWVVAATVAVGVVAPFTARDPADVPLALDGSLDKLSAGTPVFNAYELGGWIAWRHPTLEQYIDGLITPYSTQHAEDFIRAQTRGPGWYRVILDSGAPVALIAESSPLAKGLKAKGWTVVGTDIGYVLLEQPAAAEG